LYKALLLQHVIFLEFSTHIVTDRLYSSFTSESDSYFPYTQEPHVRKLHCELSVQVKLQQHNTVKQM